MVTYHGIALNVNTDISKFYGIRPCGMDSEIMTSMERILGMKVGLEEVKKGFFRKAGQTKQETCLCGCQHPYLNAM